MGIKTLAELNPQNTQVILRCDLNVPIKDGAIAPPSALSPWQEEQPLRKICFPSSMDAVREDTVCDC